MIAFAILVAMSQQAEEATRTPSIFRCPAIEGESKFFPTLVEDEFDTVCIDPKPGPLALAAAKGKVKFVTPSSIDTKANLRWRNITLDYINGKISPKQWLAQTKNLGETVHFLSSPKTPKLRDATGKDSHRAVFSEMLILCWPGRPCLTSDDIGRTRYLPDPGALMSWILAMNDYRGPMLYYRHDAPFLVTGKPKIIRADAKPGLLIFSQTDGKKTITFYLNNSQKSIDLPPLNLDKATIQIGLNIDTPKPSLYYNSFLIVES